MAEAGNHEVARRGGGHMSWQAQYFVCVCWRMLEVCGSANFRGRRRECRCDTEIGGSVDVV